MSKSENGRGSFIRHIWEDAQAIRDAKMVAMMDNKIRAAAPDISEEEIPEIRRRSIETSPAPNFTKKRWTKIVDRHETRQQQKPKI